MTSASRSKFRTGLLSLVLVVAIGLVVTLTVVYLLISPSLIAQNRLKAWAEHYAKLTQIQDFTWFHGEATYYSIRGRDEEGRDMLLLSQDLSQPPQLLDHDGILTQEDVLALAQKQGLIPEAVAIGRYRDRLVWEVTSQHRYYLFDARTGDFLQVLG